jgi:hydroxymethylbilane synthase
MVPAVGQGVIAIESREDDPRVRKIIACLNDEESAAAIAAERALMHELEGGCQVPIGAHAVVFDGTLAMNAYVGSIDGTRHVRDLIEGPVEEAAELGVALAKRMFEAGGEEILAEIRIT